VCERLVEWVLDVLLSIVAHSYAFLCYSTVPAIAARLLGQCCLILSSNLKLSCVATLEPNFRLPPPPTSQRKHD
jgi:hypothetical protein